MSEQSDYIELIRIGDPVQADLLAAFLEDGDVEFQVVNRSGAGFMSQLIPRAANPVVFRILEEDLERGKALLEEYRALQKASIPPDDQADTDDDNEDGSAEAMAAETDDAAAADDSNDSADVADGATVSGEGGEADAADVDEGGDDGDGDGDDDTALDADSTKNE